MDKKFSFEVDDFNIIEELEDEQMAIVEVYVCHDGNNAHNLPISLDVLKKSKNTLRNKFLVAGFDGKDFEGHEPDEQIVGFFPESSKMSFVKKNDKTYLVAQAIMSKVYAKWAYDLFVKDNERAVSMEISVFDFKENEDGTTDLLGFVFNGVTILGHDHIPACEGSNAQIIKFSQESASKAYSKRFSRSNAIKQQFVDQMQLTVFSGKEDLNRMDEKEKELEKVEDSKEEETTYMTEDEKKDEEVKEVKSETEASEKEDEVEEDSKEDFTAEKSEEEKEDNKEKSNEDKESDKEEEPKEDEPEQKDMSCDKSEMESLKTENGKLKDEKAEYEAKIAEYEAKIAKYEATQKAQEVEAILSEVVEVFSAEEMEDLRNEAKDLNLEELNAFSNRIKAKAFENVKSTTAEKKSFTKVAIISDATEMSTKGLW